LVIQSQAKTGGILHLNSQRKICLLFCFKRDHLQDTGFN